MGSLTTKSETGLTCGTNYTRYVWAYDNCGGSNATTLTQSTLWCCGAPITDARDGKSYNTVLIGSQCWLKENMAIGTMVSGSKNQTNNGIIEKYCYNDQQSNCDVYGGLYQWNEAMQYTTTQGGQGICPSGWHFATDSEWKILEGTVDSQYGVGNPVWNLDGMRGYDVGKNLKSTSGWYTTGNGTDLFGFTALPNGQRMISGAFGDLTYTSYNWTSTQSTSTLSWRRNFYYYGDGSERDDLWKEQGRGVRCVKN